VRRLLLLLLVIWFIVGILAAFQRNYFKSGTETCAKAGTIIATVAAGPLNYAGVNPKVRCSVPRPSK
jgi:hypothetical protein